MQMEDNHFMKRTLEAPMRRVLSIAVAAAALGTVGCAEPEPSLIVTAHVPLVGSVEDVEVPVPNGEEGETVTVERLTGCVAPGGIDEVEVSYHSVLVNLAETEGNGFGIGLLMENRLVDSSAYSPSGFDQNQRLDQNYIEVQEYIIKFDDTGFDNLGDGGEIAVPSSGLVPTDGALWVNIPLFRGTASEQQAWEAAHGEAATAGGGSESSIVPTFAEIQIIGETVGGQRVRSNILTMPVEVCNGCNYLSTPTCVDPAL